MPCTEAEHEKLMGCHKTLYGEDGMSGLVAKVDDKVDKKCLSTLCRKPPLSLVIFLIAVIIIPVILTGIQVWSDQDKGVLLFTTKIESLDREKRIIILENNLISMTDDIQTIKKDLSRQSSDINHKLDNILIEMKKEDK